MEYITTLEKEENVFYIWWFVRNNVDKADVKNISMDNWSDVL